ncbi:MAG: DUF1292 domain-containing protein [Lachnospiraceae bacterium]|jgi:hypothetical protein|nr:DUF1292 domain-containing protein [Lachnospiraceae bacterium]
MDEKIVLTDESGEEIELYAVEETRVAGVNYLLAAEEEGDGACFILRDISSAEDSDAVYEVVEDENELEYLFHIFKELVGDIDLEY